MFSFEDNQIECIGNLPAITTPPMSTVHAYRTTRSRSIIVALAPTFSPGFARILPPGTNDWPLAERLAKFRAI